MRMVKKMECKKCGTVINNPGISFCPTCGNYLREVNNNNYVDNSTIKNDTNEIIQIQNKTHHFRNRQHQLFSHP